MTDTTHESKMLKLKAERIEVLHRIISTQEEHIKLLEATIKLAKEQK